MDTNLTQFEKVTTERFRYVFLLFSVAGLPINVENTTKLRFLYNAVMLMCTYSLYIATVLELIFGRSDTKHFMKTFRDFIAMFMYMWLQFNISYRMKNLRLLLRLSESFTYADLPTKDSETGDETIAGFIPRLHSAMKRAIIAALVIYFIQSIIRTLTTRGLMYNGWYYLDLSASPTFELIQITQVITTFHLLGMFFGPIYLFALLACIGCTQFEKISGFLSEIEKEYMTMDVWARSENQKQLNNCIRLHQDTTKYLSLLEKNVNTMVCGVFLCLLTGLCSTAFSLVMSWGDYTDMSQAVLTYCLYLGLLFCYCRIGTITSEKYESVRDAAWASDWVGAPLPYQRCILFIIAKSNQEFYFTAGKFVSVSHDTMMSMINQSFSFFMFLLTMKDKSDGKA